MLRAGKAKTYERGEAQTFYNDFFQVFGIERRSRAFYEMAVKKLDNRQGYIDLFWPHVLLAEHKSTGYDLKKAMEQAEEYFVSLKDSERPRYLLACDFQRFYLVDIEKKKDYRFGLHELPEHIGLFNFMEGVEREPERIKSDPVNIRASEMMGMIFKFLKETRYPAGDMEYLLTRLAFCLFADDTGIFENGIFEEYIKKSTDGSGGDLGLQINQPLPDNGHTGRAAPDKPCHISGTVSVHRRRSLSQTDHGSVIRLSDASPSDQCLQLRLVEGIAGHIREPVPKRDEPEGTAQGGCPLYVRGEHNEGNTAPVPRRS